MKSLSPAHWVWLGSSSNRGRDAVIAIKRRSFSGAGNAHWLLAHILAVVTYLALHKDSFFKFICGDSEKYLKGILVWVLLLNFEEVFLSVRPYLGSCSTFDMLLYFSPLLSIESKSFNKSGMFFIGPTSYYLPLFRFCALCLNWSGQICGLHHGSGFWRKGSWILVWANA